MRYQTEHKQADVRPHPSVVRSVKEDSVASGERRKHVIRMKVLAQREDRILRRNLRQAELHGSYGGRSGTG